MKFTRGQLITIVLCLIPFIWIVYASQTNALSANPIQDATLRTGRNAILLLWLSLVCTPLRNLFGLSALIPIRKILGLFSFFSALLHFLIFAVLDYELNPNWIQAEFQQKPFLRIGLIALITLLLLAMTSFRSIQKKMKKWWQRLHRLVYPLSILVIWHYYLASKGDIIIPLVYTVVLIILILLRLPPLSKISISSKPRWLREVNQFLLR